MGIFKDYSNLAGYSTGKYKGKDYSIAYDHRKEFSKVYHVTHLPASKYLLESQNIEPHLIQDKSKLNTERIKVIWLSPNTWYKGSLYGNIQFTFDFNKIIIDKNFYAVEVMDEYTPHACRILITAKDYSSHPLLESYNPENKYDGPWYMDSNGVNYYHESYNIEFMLDDELLSLKDASQIDFVNHHPEYCNMEDYGACKYLNKSRDFAKMHFVSYIIANDIKLKNLNLYLDKDDDDWSIATVIDHIIACLGKKQIFEASTPISPLTKVQIIKSILDLISKEKYSEAINLSQIFASMQDVADSLRTVFGSYFEIESSLLDSDNFFKNKN